MRRFTQSNLPLRRFYQQGLSLVEILVATALVGLVLTAVSTLLTVTLKNAAQARYRETATQLAQAGMEFFNRENAQQSWSNFAGFFPENSSTYCLEILPTNGRLNELDGGACNYSQEIEENGGVFKREAVIERNPTTPNEMSITVVTSWEDSTRTVEVTVSKVFRKL